jgi:hypothetical protein
LERLLHIGARVADEAPLDPAALCGIAAADAAKLVFRFRSSYGYLSSPWPIAAIWRSNQMDAAEDGIDLDAGGVLLEICRRDGVVQFREMTEPDFAFRAALADGACLPNALVAAARHAGNFDSNTAFAALFSDGALTGFNLIESE